MSEMVGQRIRTAFLCDRLGPYHLARLNAANRLAAITAIEFSLRDDTYAWDLCTDKARFSRITLFKDKPISMQPRRVVAKRVRAVLEALCPHVVVISGWDAPASLTALTWCLETKTSTVMMSESQQQDEPRVWWKEALKGRIVQLSDAGFVGGTPHKAYLNILGMPEELIFTGCDVVDNEYFAQGAESARRNAADLRKQYDLPERYFLVSSRFVQKKNLSRVLQAYARYLKNSEDKQWKLIFLGDGPFKGQIINLREELRLNEMVLLPGFAQYPDLPVYYGLAGAFILASTSEQWGLVVNESMASGLPVLVSSSCGCAPDLVKEGTNGFMFNPYDVEGLSHHLSHVANDESLRNAMGAAGCEIIAGWSPELFAQNLKSAIDVAIQTPQKGFSLADKMILKALIRK